MKLPNSYGSVYKLSGKRRNPYAVRITTGWTDEGKQIRKMLGYYHTKKEAMDALALYNQDPYDLSAAQLTLKEVYEKWYAEYFKFRKENRSYISAFKSVAQLHDMPFASIKVNHLEQAIESASCGQSTKARFKEMMNAVYLYAIKHEICEKNQAKLMNTIRQEPTEHHEAFTDAQIRSLEALQGTFADYAIICIYSGWRPSELLDLKLENIHLDEGYMIGGMKTEAGTDRTVPIHSYILPIITRRYNEAKKDGSDYLFYSVYKSKFSYNTLRRNKWQSLMRQINVDNHSPHDCRATFITLAKRNGMDEYMLKRIVGHDINDITEAVYTTRTIEELKKEIEKIQAIC